MSQSNDIKVCSKCKLSKPYNEFRKDKSKVDGHYPSCTDCYRDKYNIIKGGKRVAAWKWRIHKSGYVVTGNNIRQHRWIIEQHLGRKLDSKEHVHHINHNKSDNRLENLVVLSASEHERIHPGRTPKGRIVQCVDCGQKKYYCQAHLKNINKTSPRCRNCYNIVLQNRFKWEAM